MNRFKTGRAVGLIATILGAVSAALIGDYTTAAGIVGAALAGMTTAPKGEE